jgi:membrane protein implicated in regulation of membrane protease activity
MDQIAWIIWLVLGVALIVAEIFTLGFVLLWFGVGAIAASLAGMAGLGLAWQFIVFAIVSIGLTAEDTVKMGVDSLPGQVGTVTLGSQGALHEGAVKVYGSTWTAFPADAETQLVEGEKVEVVRVKGSSIYVRRLTNELPEWRRD